MKTEIIALAVICLSSLVSQAVPTTRGSVGASPPLWVLSGQRAIFDVPPGWEIVATKKITTSDHVEIQFLAKCKASPKLPDERISIFADLPIEGVRSFSVRGYGEFKTMSGLSGIIDDSEGKSGEKTYTLNIMPKNHNHLQGGYLTMDVSSNRRITRLHRAFAIFVFKHLRYHR